MNGKMDMVVFNVQSANCIWISTPNNKNFVFDIGVGTTVTGQVVNPLTYIYHQGIRNIDALVLTHPHSDHIEGINKLGLFTVGTLYCARNISRDEILGGNMYNAVNWVDQYLNLESGYRSPIYWNTSPFNPNNNGGVTVQIFSQSSTAISNLNNRSLVSIVEYLGFKVLLPGDAEPAAFRVLMENSSFCEVLAGVNVMVVPHHGRESGYCGELFDYFTPQICVVSDGEVQETDATSKYSAKATGVTVINRDSGQIEHNRKCLTTRSDGAMIFSFYINPTTCQNEFTVKTHV